MMSGGLAWVLSCFLLLTIAVEATTYVAPNGGVSGPGCGLSMISPCSSIDDAIAHGDGDVILLNGTHVLTAPISLHSESLSVQGETSSPHDTVIDCNGHGGFQDSLTIRFVTMKNCERENHGGAITAENGPLIIEDCFFLNCRTLPSVASFNGGAVNVVGENLTISRTVFDGCSSDNGGALQYRRGYSSPGLITDTVFRNCSASSGGGVFLLESTVVFERVSFIENTARFGGAAYVSDGTVSFISVNVTSNTGTERVGGLYLASDGYIDFSGGNNLIEGNIDTGDNPVGGIFITRNPIEIKLNSTTTIVRDNFPNNVVGGGFDCPFCGPGACYFESEASSCSCPGDGGAADLMCQATVLYVAAESGQSIPCGWNETSACDSLTSVIEGYAAPPVLRVLLLPGVHAQSQDLGEWIQGDVSFESLSGQASDTVIDCQGHKGLTVDDVHLSLANLTLRGCERAVRADEAATVVEGCTFENCFVEGLEAGGAISSFGASLIVRDSIFRGCSSASGDGGAVLYRHPSPVNESAVFENVLFENNLAGDVGGAVSAIQGVISFTNTTWRGNEAATTGSAVYLWRVDADFSQGGNVIEDNTGSAALHIDVDVSVLIAADNTVIRRNTPRNVKDQRGVFNCGECNYGMCDLLPQLESDNPNGCLCDEDVEDVITIDMDASCGVPEPPSDLETLVSWVFRIAFPIFLVICLATIAASAVMESGNDAEGSPTTESTSTPSEAPPPAYPGQARLLEEAGN